MDIKLNKSNKTPQQMFYMLYDELDGKLPLTWNVPDKVDPNNFNMSYAELAVAYGANDVIKKLVKSINPKTGEFYDISDFPIESAISYWNTISSIETIQLLLELGAAVYHETIDRAISRNLPDKYIKQLVDIYLVDNDIDNEDEDYGLPILGCAIEKDNFEIINYLLDKGADIHYINSGGENYFCYAHSKIMVKFLLEKGLNINLRS
jgi:ankyrin repeat protein